MPLLEVQHVQKIYTTRFGGTQVQALSNVSFSVEEGEYVAIMGESGSGKTTLLNILAALDRPTAGEVLLEGRPLSAIRERDLAAFRRSHLGFVFQDFNLLDTFSLQDNIYLPLVLAGTDYREMQQKLRPIADQLGISDILAKYPYEVSGGQKQRAAVARALITDPQLILADEPSKGLDEKRVSLVVEAFEQLKEESLLCVTHDMMFAGRISDHICVLYAAQQVEYGPTEEILKNPLHPYTQDMILAIPENGMKVSMTGFAPPHTDYQNYGCRYKHRCRFCTSKCDTMPPVFTLGDRKVRCWKYENEN